MIVDFRKIRGPYGRNRHYLISLPREYVESVLRKGYSGFIIARVREVALLIPARGWEIEEVAARINENFFFLEEVEQLIMTGTCRLRRLERLIDDLERCVKMIRLAPPTAAAAASAPSAQPAEPSVDMGVDEDLPSFLRGNPWLEVLSKRGRAPEPSYI